MIHVVIPVHDRVAHTLECLRSVFEQARCDVHVIVVDAGSQDATADRVAEAFPAVTVIPGDDAWWWTAATNRGVREALTFARPGDSVLTLNNDTRLMGGFMTALTDAMKGRRPQRKIGETAGRPLIGSVMLSDRDGSVVDGGQRIASWFTAAYRPVNWPTQQSSVASAELAPVDVLSGRGTLVPIEAYKAVGLYDERRLPHYGADYEFSRRACRAGFGLYVCVRAQLIGAVDATGLHGEPPSNLRSAARSLWSIRSANSLRYRWAYARLVCPRAALPSFLACDTARVVGGAMRGAPLGIRRRATR